MKSDQIHLAEIQISRLLAAAAVVVLVVGWSAPLSWGSEYPSGQSTGTAKSAVPSLALALNTENNPSSQAQTGQSQEPRILPSDPWQANQLMKPEELAKSLSGTTGDKPLVLCVGVPPLYQRGHIVASKFMGPASKPEGLQTLKHEVQHLPLDKPVVLYCGCCPWNSCPNIRPAFRALHELGFTNVTVLYLPKYFQQDWIARGFAIQNGDDGK